MGRFQYDVSIIIPVYNVEKYLRECLDSILRQSYDLNKIEIILIDDGSKDKSGDICREYSDNYDNVVVLKQENAGVSVARNNGIKNARGKYIMLLDSDDFISKNAVKKLVNFFDKHYDEIDIVTYPIYLYSTDGKKVKQPRYDLFDKKTGIYDINEYIQANQCTINIVFKNELEKTNLFDVDMKLSEDQKFDTALIMRKEKLGYVSEARYYYRRYPASVSQVRNNPYYCFYDIIGYMEWLLDEYRQDGKVPKYIQALIANNLKWRIATDQLFPYYQEKEEYQKSVERIKNIVKEIDVDVFDSCSEMNYWHKIFFYKLTGRKFTLEKVDEGYEIYCDGVPILSFTKIKGFLTHLKVKGNKLNVMGEIMSPLFQEETPEIYLEKHYLNGEVTTELLNSFISNSSYHNSKIFTDREYGFNTVIDLDKVSRFKVYVKILGKKFNIDYHFKKFVRQNFISGPYNIVCSNKSSSIIIRKATFLNKLKSYRRNLMNCLRKNFGGVSYRILAHMYNPFKDIWLYTDRGDALDNAYTLFKNDFKREDGIRRYYVSFFTKEEIDKYFTPEEKKYLIRKDSFKHKMLFLKSQKIFTSFADLQVYSPFKKISFYSDLTNYELIYLQHGILHANLVTMYAKEFTEIDKFVISTNFEKNNLIEKYHYLESDLLLSGMPRIKVGASNKKPAKKILFAPSWRKYLIGPLLNNKRQLMVNEFQNSEFFKETSKFLNSKKLQDFLKKNKYQLDFKLHPIFKQYAKYYKIDSKYVNINFDDTDIDEYSIFITDFSSFQFDFVNLRRPIIYFVPDMDKFKAGLHSYRELDLKYEDAFGNLCLNSDELMKELEKIVKNGVKPEKKYLKRMDKFFLDIKNPCEQIYEEVTK